MTGPTWDNFMTHSVNTADLKMSQFISFHLTQDLKLI
jgi:hypothetical protein